MNKNKVEAVCTMGDGPDILLKCSNNSKDYYDLNLEEAKVLLASLYFAIQQVEELNQMCEDNDEMVIKGEK